jgi:hypothetical protein
VIHASNLGKYTQENQEFQFLLNYITSSSSARATRDTTVSICFEERKSERERGREGGGRGKTGHIVDTEIYRNLYSQET